MHLDFVPKRGRITGDPHEEIAFLKCHKCNIVGWSTKNWEEIGASPIYFEPSLYNTLPNCKWFSDHISENNQGRSECNCSINSLTLDTKVHEHIKQCPICQDYGLYKTKF